MAKARTTRKKTISPKVALTAYEVSGEMNIHIEKASPKRTWMDQTRHRFAYRCLPMVIANQMGWWIPNQVDFNAKWNGGPNPDDVTIVMPKGKQAFGNLRAEEIVVSNFGEGIITFSVPYLFRTPAGTNLWVRGPSNYPRDGIQALEGIVETDWSHSTFTMNWKFTRPNHLVRFRPGEPICQIVPIQRHFAEQMEPIVRSIRDEPELAQAYFTWHDSRDRFIHDLRIDGSDAQKQSWQHEYFTGLQAEGTTFEEHQTKLQLKEFTKP